jgi:hypothetical protein
MSLAGETMSDDQNRPKPPRTGSTPKMMLPPTFPKEPSTEQRPKDRPALDEMLRNYLEEQAQEKADGNTIANVRLELHQVQIVQQEHGAEIQMLKLRADRHGKAIRELKNRVDATIDAGGHSAGFIEHDTGVHQVEDLKKHLAAKEEELKEFRQERRDSVTWWRRKRTDVLIGVAGALAMLGITTVGGIIWYVITHPSPPTHQEK